LLNLPLFKGEGPGKATPALKRAIESLGENAKIEVLSAMRANALFGHSFRSYRLAEYNPKNEIENHKKFNFFGDDVGDVVKANMK
jgi:ATP:corrinoid adenosyltransferase